MLLVVCCLLCVMRYSLSAVVRCSSFVVARCCLSCDVCRLLLVVRCLLIVSFLFVCVMWLLFVGCCSLSIAVCCLSMLFVV